MINWCVKLPGGLNRFRAESNLRMDFHNVVEKDHLEIYLVILSVESLRSLLDEQRDTIWAGLSFDCVSSWLCYFLRHTRRVHVEATE